MDEARTRMRVIDFRAGKNGWGHNLHGSTWCALPSRKPSLLERIKRTQLPPRASVMVHTSPSPYEGDTVVFTGKRTGLDLRWSVVEVRPCGNPDDMYTLVLEQQAQRAGDHPNGD